MAMRLPPTAMAEKLVREQCLSELPDKAGLTAFRFFGLSR
jgi:hypothetical protein